MILSINRYNSTICKFWYISHRYINDAFPTAGKIFKEISTVKEIVNQRRRLLRKRKSLPESTLEYDACIQSLETLDLKYNQEKKVFKSIYTKYTPEFMNWFQSIHINNKAKNVYILQKIDQYIHKSIIKSTTDSLQADSINSFNDKSQSTLSAPTISDNIEHHLSDIKNDELTTMNNVTEYKVFLFNRLRDIIYEKMNNNNNSSATDSTIQKDDKDMNAKDGSDICDDFIDIMNSMKEAIKTYDTDTQSPTTTTASTTTATTHNNIHNIMQHSEDHNIAISSHKQSMPLIFTSNPPSTATSTSSSSLSSSSSSSSSKLSSSSSSSSSKLSSSSLSSSSKLSSSKLLLNTSSSSIEITHTKLKYDEKVVQLPNKKYLMWLNTPLSSSSSSQQSISSNHSTDNILSRHVITSLNRPTSLSEELELFVQYIKPTYEEKIVRKHIVHDLHKAVYRKPLISPTTKMKFESVGSWNSVVETFISDIDLAIPKKDKNISRDNKASKRQKNTHYFFQKGLDSYYKNRLYDSVERENKISVLYSTLPKLKKIRAQYNVIEVRESAKVPIIYIQHYTDISCDIGISYDSSNTQATEFLTEMNTIYPYFAPITMILKLLLHIHNLDEPFQGGLGSFRLYVLVANFMRKYRIQNKCGIQSLGDGLIQFFYFYSRKQNMIRQYSMMTIYDITVNFRSFTLLPQFIHFLKTSYDILTQQPLTSPLTYDNTLNSTLNSDDVTVETWIGKLFDTEQLYILRAKSLQNAHDYISRHKDEPDFKALFKNSTNHMSDMPIPLVKKQNILIEEELTTSNLLNFPPNHDNIHIHIDTENRISTNRAIENNAQEKEVNNSTDQHINKSIISSQSNLKGVKKSKILKTSKSNRVSTKQKDIEYLKFLTHFEPLLEEEETTTSMTTKRIVRRRKRRMKKVTQMIHTDSSSE